MGLDILQLDRFVVHPVLDYLDMDGLAARRLVVGTGLVESGLKYLRQLGSGPAFGIFQMEPATHDDCWATWLNYRPAIADKVRALRGDPAGAGVDAISLIGNLNYAAALCRVKYRRVPERLPAPDDAAGMARYHKRYYNSALGKTDPAESVEHFRRAIEVIKA